MNHLHYSLFKNNQQAWFLHNSYNFHNIYLTKSLILKNMKYKKIINSLVNQEKENGIYLSLYLPLKGFNNKKAKRRLRSLIDKGFKKNKQTEKLTNLDDLVKNKVIKRFEKLSSLEKGLGVFAKISVDEANKGAESKIEDLTVVQFSKGVKKEVFVGTTYDLDQLIWLNNLEAEALVIDLHRDECNVYILENERLKSVQTIENNFSEFKEPEYLYKPPILIDEIYFSPGSNKVEQQKVKENRYFMNDILDKLKENSLIRERFKYLVVFYSERYKQHIDGFVRSAPVKADFNPILVERHPQIKSKKAFKKIAERKLKKYQKQKVKELYKLAEEDYNHFVKGWKKVLKAARQAKIEQLFIRPGVKKQGYVDHQLLYLHKSKKTRKVNNLAPWLVRSVFENDGKVVMLRKNLIKKSPKVAAKLRYQ
jgi:hypothetical protein